MSKVFISYDYTKDRDFVNGIKGMIANPNIDVTFYDNSVRDEINSTNSAYIKSKISDLINASNVLLCIVGTNTHSSEWVKWEVQYARSKNKRIIFMRRKDDYSSSMSSNILFPNRIENWDVNLLKNL